MFNLKILKSKYFDKKLHKPYLIAEAGVNHECSMKIALKMIKLAKMGGADAIKFQYYKAETLASKSPAYWDTKKEKSKNQFQLFKNTINLIFLISKNYIKMQKIWD